MSRYAKVGKVAKCGSPDSKYMGNLNGLDNDFQRKYEEVKSFENALRELFINSPGRTEHKYQVAINVFLEIKKEFNL